MNERKLRQLNILIVITVAVGFILMGVFAFMGRDGANNRIRMKKLNALNDTWVLNRQGETEQTLIDLPQDLKGAAGEVFTITHQMPEDASKDTALCFYTDFQNVIVWVGNNRVYENGVLTEQKLIKNAVPAYHVVDIGDVEGDSITIQFSSLYKRFSGELPSVYYGSRGDVVSYLIRKDGVPFVVALMIIVIVLLLGFSLFFMSNVDRRKAAYGFGFILFAAAWTFMDNSLMQLVSKNQFAVYMCSQMFLLLMPILYFMYLRCFALRRRYAKIFEIAIYVYAINFLTGVVFQFVGVCDFAGYMFFTKILILLGLLLLCFVMYLAADTYSDRSLYSDFWANVILTASACIEFILCLFQFYKNYRGLVLQIGLFVFAVLLMISIEKSIIQEMNAERDAALNSIGHEKTEAVKMINTGVIYNALNTAITDLKTHDLENSRLLYDTSIFLQYNMDAVHKQGRVPFTEELAYIRAYLGMQRRIHPELSVVVEDKVTDFKVPYNTIEPLVENAVINGALTSDGDAKIVIRCYERLDCYAIQIVDNGQGMSPAKKFTGKQSFASIKRKLKASAGAFIDIKTKQGKGTILTVKIAKDGYIVKE